MAQTILEMAKDLVSGLIKAGHLSPDDMQEVLQSTYQSLINLKLNEETGASPAETLPSRDWRKSITRHAVTCLECGQSFKQISVRHLRQHDLDGRSYRSKYGIPSTQPLAAKVTTARRREVAQEVRPWEKTPRALQAKEDEAAMAKKGMRK